MTTMNHLPDEEQIATKLGALLEELLATGHKLPFHFAALGTNGAVMAGTFVSSEEAGGLDCQFHAEWFPDAEGSLRAPVNMMLIDGRGEAFRVVFERGKPPTIIQ